MQAKLLRFLQEGQFERVGAENSIKVDVRVLSATNKNLKEEVRCRRFREDLFYRLNVIPVELPPLRERKLDIPLLIDHFLAEAARRYDKRMLKVSSRAMSNLLDYRWPGNVRELQNAIQFAFVRCNGKVINPDDLPIELREAADPPARRGPNRKLDQEAVKSALLRTGGNKARAAKNLGVGRATLYRFLKDYPDLSAAGRI
jgi:DNA-binding NtrC family response regulator